MGLLDAYVTAEVPNARGDECAESAQCNSHGRARSAQPGKAFREETFTSLSSKLTISMNIAISIAEALAGGV
jgi:hypothetical protein